EPGLAFDPADVENHHVGYVGEDPAGDPSMELLHREQPSRLIGEVRRDAALPQVLLQQLAVRGVVDRSPVGPHVHRNRTSRGDDAKRSHRTTSSGSAQPATGSGTSAISEAIDSVTKHRSPATARPDGPEPAGSSTWSTVSRSGSMTATVLASLSAASSRPSGKRARSKGTPPGSMFHCSVPPLSTNEIW